MTSLSLRPIVIASAALFAARSQTLFGRNLSRNTQFKFLCCTAVRSRPAHAGAPGFAGPALRAAGGHADPAPRGTLAVELSSGPMATSDEKAQSWLRDATLPFQRLDEEAIVVDPRTREVHLLNVQPILPILPRRRVPRRLSELRPHRLLRGVSGMLPSVHWPRSV